jgi:hypothetical protein
MSMTDQTVCGYEPERRLIARRTYRFFPEGSSLQYISLQIVERFPQTMVEWLLQLSKDPFARVTLGAFQRKPYNQLVYVLSACVSLVILTTRSVPCRPKQKHVF